MSCERAIPYGVTDFKRIRNEKYYYIDKTAFIAPMERRDSFIFFVRPRRFGKSLLIDTLRCYYDVAEKENFQNLFGDLAVGRDPTPGANKYWVLTLNFSKVSSPTSAGLEGKFLLYMTARLGAFVRHYAESFPPEFVAEVDKLPPEQVYQRIVEVAATPKGHPLYILIDEYDNFTNTLVASEGKLPYQEITHKAGFYRGWFRLFKDDCSRIFMTGTSPATFYDDRFIDISGLSDLTQAKNLEGIADLQTSSAYWRLTHDGDPMPFLESVAQGNAINAFYSDRSRMGSNDLSYVKSHLKEIHGYYSGGFSDYAFFPDQSMDDASRPTVSYVVELKHAKSAATDAELAALHAEALAQLKRYASDPHLPALAGGTPVHYLCYEFKGRDLFRLEEVDPATGATIG